MRGAPPVLNAVRRSGTVPRMQARLWPGLATLWFAAVVGASAAEVPVKVMSMNLSGDSGAPSGSNSNAWNYTGGPSRRERAVRVIVDEAPDIAGIQEVETNQVADLVGTNGPPGYAWFGAGRVDGLGAGQHEMILYRADRFVRRETGVFWLSQTPDVPDSRYPGAALTRIAVWARLLDRWSGRPYLVFSTHWDYASAAARLYSAQLMRSHIAELASNSWVVITGDLNMQPTDPAYGALRGTNDLQSLQILDAYRQVYPVEQSNELTSHNFTGNTAGKRIDYIFHTGEFAASAAAIVHTSYDGGLYPSDHYPVTATLHTAMLEPVLLAASAGPGDIELTWESASGLFYRVSASSDLLEWHDAYPATGSLLGTGQESRCSLPLGGVVVRSHYRVVRRPAD